MALKEPTSSLFGRRDFITRGGLVCLSAATAAGIGLGLRALWPRSGTTSAFLVPAGRPEDYAVGQVSEALLLDHEVWVIRTESAFYSYSAICTHLGCRLRHSGAAGEYRCMCHGSAFGHSGEALRGPASRPMERVYIALDAEGRLWVDPSVRYRQERGEWARPGSFVRYGPGRRG